MPLPEPAPRPAVGYLDAVAGQPLLPVARTAWLAAVDQAWSDPARLHHEGRRAGILLDAARSSIAAQLGIRPDDVFLTSSGPTAIAAAVTGILARTANPRVVASAVESLAVRTPARRARLDLVPVDGVGRIDIDALGAALSQPADLVCVQQANGEVGTRQPLAEVAGLARASGIPLLVHAIQSIGRDPIAVHWDILAASARDWGGPAGVGVLAVRPGVGWRPEESPDRGWVGGFPDVPGAAAAAAALEYLAPVRQDEAERARALVDRVRDALPGLVDGVVLAGDPVDRLPHILTFTVDGVTGEPVVRELERRGVLVASGSACTSDTRMGSEVLEAMGIAAEASVRVSLPLGCPEGSVDRLLDVVGPAIVTARAG